MYLRCDGNLTFDASGSPACDNWALISEAELLSAFKTQNSLAPDDFAELMTWIFILFAIAFGIKMVRSIFDQNASRH